MRWLKVKKRRRLRTLSLSVCSLLLIGMPVFAHAAAWGGTSKFSRLLERFPQPKGRVDSTSVWSSNTITVCWEASAKPFPLERQWTQDAVLNTWQAHSDLKFVGWGGCAPGASGVHLTVADEDPEAMGVGNQLDGVDNG